MNPADQPGYLEELPEYPRTAFTSQWGRYIYFTRQLWWVPVLGLALAICGTALFLALRATTYESAAKMFVAGQLKIPEGSLYSEELQFFFGTQVELMQSDKIRQRARDRVKTLDPELVPSPVKLKVSQAPKTSVFNLTVTGPDPKYARAYLDAVMDEYLNYKKETRANTSEGTLQAVSEQLTEQEKDLRTAQDELADFQRDNNLTVLQDQSTAASSYLGKLTTQLSDLKLELRLLDARVAEGPAEAGADTNLTALPPGVRLGSATLAPTTLPAEWLPAQRQLQELKLQREELGRFLRPKHPKMQRLNEDIARAEKILDQYRRETREQMAGTRQVLEARIATLEDSIKDWEAKLVDANARIAQAESLKLKVQRIQSLYDRLLHLLQNVDVNRNLARESLSIMERASAAEPVLPEAPLLFTLAALAGLAAGLGIISLVVRFDDRFTSLSELLNRFQEEIVGQVPDMGRHKSNGKLELVKQDDDRHMFAESYRNIRSSLLYGANEGERPRVLLVTSSAPSEGKSTVAANLATTLAFTGARILLVDGDLRRGGLNVTLETTREPGLSDLLRSQQVDLKQHLRPTALANLSFLPSGRLMQSSGELFLSATFDRVLQEAKDAFDYVVIDSAPVFAADDTTTMAPKVDGILFVVRNGYTRGNLARQALNQLYQRQAKVLGLIYNRANTASRNYYYYKYADYYHPKGKKRD